MTVDREYAASISPRLYSFLNAAGLLVQPRGDQVFHYCDADALIKIVDSGQIFATDVRFLNDTSEFEYGRSIIDRCVESSRKDMHELMDAIAGVAIERLTNRGGYDVFVSCYSEVDDLVSQWRGYGSGGHGYSLGIPWRALSVDGKALLLRVVYGDDAVEAAVQGLLSLAAEEMGTALRGHTPDPEVAEDIGTCLSSVLMLLAACSKKDLFDFEKEFRLMSLFDVGVMNPALEFRPSKGMIVPFVRQPLPRDASGAVKIATIRRGPTLNDVATDIGLRVFLDRKEMKDTLILPSEAPMR